MTATIGNWDLQDMFMSQGIAEIMIAALGVRMGSGGIRKS